MITADKLKDLTNYDRWDLAYILADSGYSGHSFETAKFLGITTSGEFCYRVTYWDDGSGPEEELMPGEVFVRYIAGLDKVEAEPC